MEGRRGDVETSPSLFSSAVSPPREMDGLSQMWPFPGVLRRQSGRSADISSQALMSIWPSFIYSSIFESFSLATTCSRTMGYLYKKYFSGRRLSDILT